MLAYIWRMQQQPVIHVAYAEDHNLIRRAIVSLLESTGTIAIDIEVEDGQQLIDELARAAARPEICIIDIGMPIMDGFTALVEIRKRWPDMKTLILTGHNSEQYVIRMIMAGANGYLLKKCSENEIHEAIMSIHNTGFYYSDCANSTLFQLIKTKVIKPQQFTQIEMEFLKWCCSELTFEQIAQKMKTTLSSVLGCRNRLFNKLNVASRVELVLFAVRFGVVSIEVNKSANAIMGFTKIKMI